MPKIEPFKGVYQFVTHKRNRGNSKKDNSPYDFATITLSDGLLSVKHDMKPHLVETHAFQNLKRGDFVEVTIDAEEGYNRTDYIVTDLKKALV